MHDVCAVEVVVVWYSVVAVVPALYVQDKPMQRGLVSSESERGI